MNHNKKIINGNNNMKRDENEKEKEINIKDNNRKKARIISKKN